jgi:hypothetical protein
VGRVKEGRGCRRKWAEEALAEKDGVGGRDRIGGEDPSSEGMDSCTRHSSEVRPRPVQWRCRRRRTLVEGKAV